MYTPPMTFWPEPLQALELIVCDAARKGNPLIAPIPPVTVIPKEVLSKSKTTARRLTPTTLLVRLITVRLLIHIDYIGTRLYHLD
jgi:hypothetical protein